MHAEARAGHEHADRGILGLDASRDALLLVAVREVGWQHLDVDGQLGSHRLEANAVAGDEDEIVTSGSEGARERGSDAGGCTGDERTHAPNPSRGVPPSGHAPAGIVETMTSTATERMFDVRAFARDARGSHRDALDLAAFVDAPLDDVALRLVAVLHHVENATMGRLRDLLVTATHKDARMTAFLVTWSYERFWIADALRAILDAHGHSTELHGKARIRPRELAERRGPVRRALLANLDGVDVVAVHATAGLVDEWIIGEAFGALRRHARHTTIDVLAAIVDDVQSRHLDFLGQEAERRLAESKRARRLTRRALLGTAWPIGALHVPARARHLLERLTFAGVSGRAALERVRDRVAALPGMDATAARLAARLVA